jgi:hypothetical protein
LRSWKEEKGSATRMLSRAMRDAYASHTFSREKIP